MDTITTKAVVNDSILEQLAYLQSDNGDGARDYYQLLDDIILETIIAEEGDPKERMMFVTKLTYIKILMRKLGNIY